MMRQPSSAIGQRSAIWLVICVGVACLAFACGWMSSRWYQGVDQAIAVSWGDGKYGKSFYGAYVYLVPGLTDYSVRAKYAIGPGNDYYHDFGEIGRATSVKDAVKRFGTIRWDESGLTIGDPDADGLHFPRERLERHR